MEVRAISWTRTDDYDFVTVEVRTRNWFGRTKIVEQTVFCSRGSWCKCGWSRDWHMLDTGMPAASSIKLACYAKIKADTARRDFDKCNR